MKPYFHAFSAVHCPCADAPNWSIVPHPGLHGTTSTAYPVWCSLCPACADVASAASNPELFT